MTNGPTGTGEVSLARTALAVDFGRFRRNLRGATLSGPRALAAPRDAAFANATMGHGLDNGCGHRHDR